MVNPEGLVMAGEAQIVGNRRNAEKPPDPHAADSMQNKANFHFQRRDCRVAALLAMTRARRGPDDETPLAGAEDRLCKTKPICQGLLGGTRGASMQNKANFRGRWRDGEDPLERRMTLRAKQSQLPG